MSVAGTRQVVGRLEELPVGTVRRVTVGGRQVCLARCESGVRAIDDTCSHEDYSLAEGELDPAACEIECWKHGSLFSLETGEPLTLPATQPVAVHQVEIEDGEIVVVLSR